MSSVEEFELYPIHNRKRSMIAHGDELIHRMDDIKFVKERFPLKLFILFLSLLREIFRIASLNVRGVRHDEIREISRSRCGID